MARKATEDMPAVETQPDVQEKVNDTPAVETQPEIKVPTPQEYENELVEITLFCDGDKYSGHETVVINGYPRQIERGKPVMIPRHVYNTLVESERQKVKANQTSKIHEQRFKELQQSNVF